MVALFRDYPAAQCALGVIVAGGVALLHVRCRPYRKPLLSSIVLTSELCIALLLLAALQYTAVDQDASTATDQVVAGTTTALTTDSMYVSLLLLPVLLAVVVVISVGCWACCCEWPRLRRAKQEEGNPDSRTPSGAIPSAQNLPNPSRGASFWRQTTAQTVPTLVDGGATLRTPRSRSPMAAARSLLTKASLGRRRPSLRAGQDFLSIEGPSSPDQDWPSISRPTAVSRLDGVSVGGAGAAPAGGHRSPLDDVPVAHAGAAPAGFSGRATTGPGAEGRLSYPDGSRYTGSIPPPPPQLSSRGSTPASTPRGASRVDQLRGLTAAPPPLPPPLADEDVEAAARGARFSSGDALSRRRGTTFSAQI